MQKSLDQKLRSLLMILTVAVLAVLFGLADTAEVKAIEYPRICIGTRWVGQNETSASAQDGSWTFSYDADSKTGTLTLNNATIYEKHTQASACIYSRTCETLIIIVNGVNNVGNTGFLVFDQYSDNSNLIIKGSGTLNAVGGYGFHSKGNIEISESTVTATATANNACGIYAGGNITISGGTVTSTATANNAYGIYAGGNITISGGTVTSTAAASDNGKAIYTENGNIKITSGTVTATANGTGDAMYVASNLEISGGTVTAKSVGAYGIRTTGNMIVEGGSVKAEGVKGIYTQGNMIVEEGSVEAEGSDSYGIAVDRSLSISGADTVFKAKGNTCAVTTGGISIDEADGLKIVKPEGGEVKSIGVYTEIYKGDEVAKEVEIWKKNTYKTVIEADPEAGCKEAKANPSESLADKPINLSATAADGYHFLKWEAVNPEDLVITDADKSSASFTMPASDVKVKAVFEKNKPGEHTIKVTPEGPGKASANHKSATAGTHISLTAKPDEGSHFKEWKVLSGNVNISNNGFEMPDEDVEIKGVFQSDGPVSIYTITFDPKGGAVDPKEAKTKENGTINLDKLPTPEWEGHVFKGWFTEDGIKVTLDTEFGGNTTVYAHWDKEKPAPKPKKHDDDEEKTEEASKPAVVNPDTVEGYFAVNGQLLPGVTMGKTKQGVAAQAVFNANRPAGWQEAFTFNMAINGKVDYTLKNGVLTIIIPKEFQKAGRTFAIMALDKNGKAWTFADTDTNPATVTATINVEGYAFALIYKD